MKKEFVPYNESVILKDLGFDEPCVRLWNNKKIPELVSWVKYGQQYTNSRVRIRPTAPLWQQAFDWIEKHHKLKVFIKWGSEYTQLGYYQDSVGEYLIGVFSTKDDANITCLRKLIKIIQL